VCKHAGLVTSVFNPAMKVPEDYVAAEQGLRKKTRHVKGSAGPRRALLMAEIKEAKKKSASKIPFMSIMMQSCKGVAAEGESALPPSPPDPTPPQPPPPLYPQSAPPADSIVIPEFVLPSSEGDFHVLVSSLCTGSSPDSGDRSPPTHGDVHAVRSSLCSSRRTGRRRLNHVPRKRPFRV
jgi:hypothetical protein